MRGSRWLCSVLLLVSMPLRAQPVTPTAEEVTYPDLRTPRQVVDLLGTVTAASAAGGAAAVGLAVAVVAVGAVTVGRPPYTREEPRWLLAGMGMTAVAGLGAALVASTATAAGALGLVLARARAWYVNWNAHESEVQGKLLGDELVPGADRQYTRAITIQGTPEEIYPWLLQLGADRGGFYSLTKIEGLLKCPMENADRIHPEWVDRKVGEPVPMCREGGPPPYVIAALHPGRAMILGHRYEGRQDWHDTWQFVLLPVDARTTRLVVRSRTISFGPVWDALEPGQAIMERGLLNGIKERVEQR